MKARLGNQFRCLQVGEGFLPQPSDNCQRNDRSSARGSGLLSDINNVYEICRVGRDPARRLWSTLYIVFGINCCPSSGNTLQYVWAPITRHPHVDSPNLWVRLLISPEICFSRANKVTKKGFDGLVQWSANKPRSAKDPMKVPTN